MLYVSFGAGALAAGRFSWALLLLAAAATLLFIGREPLLAWWRARCWGRDARNSGRMAALYLAGAACAGAPLVALYPGLGAIAAAGLALLALNTHLGARREDRTIAAELLAIAGLTLAAPATHYIGSGEWRAGALLLWLLSTVYFGSSVLYVRLRFFTAHPRKPDERRRIRRWCALYHGLLLAGLLAFDPWLLAAFVPILARAFWHLLKPAGELNLKRVGWLEVGYSLVFLLFVTASFR